MATVSVLRVFWDVCAECKRSKGDVFAATDERARELESRLPEHVAVTYEEPVETEALDYSKMTSAQLRALCRETGIEPPKRATKSQLTAILEG
jgi:hypothetical protein